MFKKIYTTGLVLLLASAVNVMGHPGTLDKYGCHKCEGEECSKWGLYDGQFHCHKSNLYGETTADFDMWREMLCHAIHNKKLVKVVMKLGGSAEEAEVREEEVDDPGIREMVLMAYAYGLDDLDQPVFRAYRLTGDASERKWETYSMSAILELIIVDIDFEEYKDGADETGIDEVECKYGVEREVEEQQS